MKKPDYFNHNINQALAALIDSLGNPGLPSNEVFKNLRSGDCAAKICASVNKMTANCIPINTHREDGAYCIEANLAGIDKNHINLLVNGNELTISVDFPADSSELDYAHCEFSKNKCKRNIVFNEDINENSINAEFKDGILFVKIETKATPESRKIKID